MRCILAVFLLLLVILTGASVAPAQSTLAELQARLVHQPLLLRGLEYDDKIEFDAAGKSTGISAKTSPMLSAVDLDKVELKDGRLILKGKREAIVYIDSKPQPQRRKLSKLRIEIGAPATGDYTAPLAAIFTTELADLAPAAPDFWQPYLTHGHDPGFPKTVLTSDEEGVRKIGGAVSAPKVLSTVQPDLGPDLRRLKVSGSCLIYFRLEKAAIISHVLIARPMGGGFDEAAVEAVKAYKFGPAMEKGSPVAVNMMLAVNFQDN